MKQTPILAVQKPKLVYLMVSALFAMPAIAADSHSSVLPEVAVVGGKVNKEATSYVATRTHGATKTDTPIGQTAQSISVVDRKELDDRNAQNLNDALGYTAGVRMEILGMDSRAESYSIRGFSGGLNTSDDGASTLFLDGLKVQAGGQWNRPSFDVFGLERVEVMKGPSAAIYGQIAPGGIINLVSKRPNATHVNEVRLQGGSFDQYKAAFDLGGSLADDQSVLFRLVGSFSDGNSQLKHTELERTFFAPSLLWQISDKTSLTLLAQYQRDKGGSTFQFLPYYGTYKPSSNGQRMKVNTFIGEPDFNTWDREQSAVGWAFEHRFNDTWQFRQNLRYTSLDYIYEGMVSRANGLSGIANPRTGTRGTGKSESVTVDNQLQADFKTGDVGHTVLLGLDAQKVDWNNTRVNQNNLPGVSMFNPVYTGFNGNFGSTATTTPYDSTQRQTGFYAQEQLSWNNWHLSLGGRYDRFDNHLTNAAATRPVAAHFDFNDHSFTWRTGLLYQFQNGIAPYFSYSTSFEPGSMTAITLSDSRKPVKGDQYEAGVKWAPEGGNTLLTASVYEITQENRFVNEPNAAGCTALTGAATGCSRQVGEAKIRGVEVEGKTKIGEHWNLIGSYTYMDSEITKTELATERGNALSQVPKHMSSLWASYLFTNGYLDGISVGAGVRYTGGSYGSVSPAAGAPVDNPLLYTDSYTTYDAAVRYNLKSLGYSGAEFALNANNLTDRLYVTSCSGMTACFYGMGRNVTATLKYNW